MDIAPHDVSNIGREEAAICEPAAVALRAFNKSGVGAEESILIHGIGLIGLLIAQWAKAEGVKKLSWWMEQKKRWSWHKRWVSLWLCNRASYLR